MCKICEFVNMFVNNIGTTILGAIIALIICFVIMALFGILKD